MRKDDRHQSLDKTLAALVKDGAHANKDDRGASEVIALTSLTEESLDMLAHTTSLVATVVPHFDLLASIELVKAGSTSTGGGGGGGGGGGADVDLLSMGLLASTTSPHTAVSLRDDRLVVPESYLEHDGPPETCPAATQPHGIGGQRCRCREARLATATIEVLSPTMESQLGKRGAQAKAAMHQRLLASLATQACGMCPAGCAKWHAADDAGAAGAAGAVGAAGVAGAAVEVSGATATPLAMDVFAARERAMQESIEAYRLKQVRGSLLR